jgi:uncharacterized NAD(P)/FAD-binding protein YdhS
MQERNIAIIGGGFSGVLLAVQLLQTGKDLPLTISLIDKNACKGLGMAYATSDPEHLLNVPASNMGAFAEEPNHFYQWLQKQNFSYSPDDFVPRQVYGQYLQQIGSEGLNALDVNHKLHLIADEATGVLPAEKQMQVVLASGRHRYCQKAVLALGNFPPANLPLSEKTYETDSRYFRNPWDAKAFAALKPQDRVLLIGTGLTMIDMCGH